jgi:Ca2+-binding RTX toxin-like protein
VSEPIYYSGAIGSSGSDGAKPYTNGFIALKSLDSNSDNQFSSADAAWNTLRVWVDANADGISDAAELTTLEDLSITSINLVSTTQSGLINGGNEVRATGNYVINGATRDAQAVDFIANPVGSTFTTDAFGVTINTEAGATGQAVSAYSTSITTGTTLNAATLGVNNLYGNNGNDTLIGNASNNWLAGGLGADTLNAGAGDDVLLFDAQDTLDGGDGDDIAQVIGDPSTGSGQVNGVVLNLAQSHIEVVIGGRGDDILIGGGRSSVFVSAGDGDDIVIGGAANDGKWRIAA